MEVETNTSGSWREEYIMSYETNGDDQWDLTKKEKIVRCDRCLYFKRKENAQLGVCRRNRYHIVKKVDDYCSSGLEK